MKNNHQADKKAVNKTTTNYPMDSHKEFCKRCMGYNGHCPITGGKPSKHCEI